MSCFQQTLHDITLHGSPDLIFMLCISKKRTRDFITSANSISVGAYSKNIPMVDVIPAWIRIQEISNSGSFGCNSGSASGSTKSGIVTPLRRAHLRTFPSRVSFVLVGRCACAHTHARAVLPLQSRNGRRLGETCSLPPSLSSSARLCPRRRRRRRYFVTAICGEKM